MTAHLQLKSDHSKSPDVAVPPQRWAMRRDKRLAVLREERVSEQDWLAAYGTLRPNSSLAEQGYLLQLISVWLIIACRSWTLPNAPVTGRGRATTSGVAPLPAYDYREVSQVQWKHHVARLIVPMHCCACIRFVPVACPRVVYQLTPVHTLWPPQMQDGGGRSSQVACVAVATALGRLAPTRIGSGGKH